MMIFIGLFLPTFIALAIRQKRNNEYKRNWFSILLGYGQGVLFCNLIIMAVITYVLKVDNVEVTALNSFPFFTKYVTMAVLYSAVVPYIEEIIRKMFSIKLTILEKNQEE